MADDMFLVLHGWGGNKPEHWQEHLVARLTEAGQLVHYPRMPDPAAPNLTAWLDRVETTLQEIQRQAPDARLTVLTHSLGAITWMHVAARNGPDGPRLADRVLLVAPPYVLPQAPPVDAPPGVETFFPPPLAPEAIRATARETTLVASDTDDYATFDQSNGYAAKLEVPIHLLKGAGHISPYYGYGEWPWVLDWCLRRAELPPQPRA
ncbi:MAG: alpha/beta hydrolase [Chloroherpetonaceae bacterium]|nr:alpha/beta hydrolase [Chthonomonadaceae bacterium]MDW8207652.1 alpha/beta hydrolase [Chloroherpetonaceae bacterium]